MARKAKTEAKTGSELVAASQKRQQDAGGGRFPTLTLSPPEMAIWLDLVARHGGDGHGAAKRTLMAALRSLEGQGEPDVPGILRRLADQVEAGR